MTNTGSPARRLVALALTAVLAAGCGTTPADSAPELGEQLARVDRAVTTGDEARIRERVESLVAATEAARDAGRIDDEQADRILTAADALMGRLPAEEPASESPSPPPSPPTTPPSPEDEDEEKPEKHGKDKKDPKDEDKPDKPGKGEGHEEEDDDD